MALDEKLIIKDIATTIHAPDVGFHMLLFPLILYYIIYIPWATPQSYFLSSTKPTFDSCIFFLFC